jgi:hypothetical protein
MTFISGTIVDIGAGPLTLATGGIEGQKSAKTDPLWASS